MSIEKMIGKTIDRVEGIEEESEEVCFHFTDGSMMKMHHIPDCCEAVWLNDFDNDSIGGLVTSATEETSEDPAFKVAGDDGETWTFYRIETATGGIWMRWIGSSNGYYSEDVDITWAGL